MMPRLDLHAIITAASPAVRRAALGWGCEGRTGVTASLLILIPWLVFAVGLVVIGLRLLVIRRARRRR